MNAVLKFQTKWQNIKEYLRNITHSALLHIWYNESDGKLLGGIKLFNAFIFSALVINIIQKGIGNIVQMNDIYIGVGITAILMLVCILFKRIINSKNLYFRTSLSATHIYLNCILLKNAGKK